ncbi:phosphoglycerol transferase MdoB-like AlkP superfamily enzyme [Bradyrhizobium sp. AZCC 2262]|uniref:hypothetical protein n=1 Tax=Bradyrhizobium sp. AZCC 2262 TaxID=3117022 RepID=UPI002FF4199D
MFKFLDAYSIRARLFPAILGAAPALAALALLISWQHIHLSNIIATTTLLVLLFALSDFARKLGVYVEPKIYAEMGGKPSVTMFRRSDKTIEDSTKDRYRTFIAGKINQPVPSSRQESANQSVADAFYEACGTWLRTHTRDAKKFPLVFGENVGYGFRRNQFGLKWVALALNLIVVAICAALLWYRTTLDMGIDLTTRTTLVFVVAVIHAAYFAFVVTKNSVKESARKYGRELILSTEALMAPAHTSAKKAGH